MRRSWDRVAMSSFAVAALLANAGCAAEEPSPPRASSAESSVQPAEPAQPEAAPRNVILLIGDGMGPQQLALLLDWADAAGASPTHFERLTDVGHLGLVRTGAKGSALTDSAASATAIACGVEVPNGVISVDENGRALRTCMEDADASGRMTGLVTTTRLTHATPASFAAHVQKRNQEKEIAQQMLSTPFVDVMLGGGAAFIDVANAPEGYRAVTTAAELEALDAAGGPVLGVFSKSHIPYAIDRDQPTEPSTVPTLAAMTQKAIDVLATGPDGFFLMVEGGRIDHGGHLNDVAAVLGEMREFDAAIGVAEAFRREHPDTLVIVTADHETGGLAISFSGRPLLPQHFLAMTEQESSIEAIAQRTPKNSREAVDPTIYGVGRKPFYPAYSWWETSRALETSATYSVSFGTQSHTTTPVAIVAAGPRSEQFEGLMHNEKIGLLLREWMGPEEAR